jgi:uncharacterized membrane protein
MIELAEDEVIVAPASRRRLRAAQGVVVLFHAVGLLGLRFSHNPDFYLQFTPLTLLLTAALLAAFQPGPKAAFWRFALLTAVLGFAIELVGVTTHKLFGYYTYGATLGPRWEAEGYAVPYLIGVNWFVVTYVCGNLARYLPLPELARTVLAAALMVGLDLCIEPVASQYDFWHWSADIIPARNFRDWFIVAVLMQLLFNRARFVKFNPLVPLVFLVQLLFFFWLG